MRHLKSWIQKRAFVQLSNCPNVQYFHHHRANYLYTFLQVTETKWFIWRLQRRMHFQVNLQVRYNKGIKGWVPSVHVPLMPFDGAKSHVLRGERCLIAGRKIYTCFTRQQGERWQLTDYSFILGYYIQLAPLLTVPHPCRGGDRGGVGDIKEEDKWR